MNGSLVNSFKTQLNLTSKGFSKAQQRGLQGSVLALSRYPKMQKTISRRQAQKLAEKPYKKHNPKTEDNEKSLYKENHLAKLLFEPGRPSNEIPKVHRRQSLEATVQQIRAMSQSDSKNKINEQVHAISKSISQSPAYNAASKITTQKGVKYLTFPDGKSASDMIPPMNASKNESSKASQSGPLYNYRLNASQIEFLLKKVTDAHVRPSETNPTKNEIAALKDQEEYAEMMRRIVSLENGNARQIMRFNKARVVEMLGRTPSDTGSPEVQVTILTTRLQNLDNHLIENPKDMGAKRMHQILTSKRTKMLKYLRRKDLPKFVQVCELIGVEPQIVRA